MKDAGVWGNGSYKNITISICQPPLSKIPVIGDYSASKTSGGYYATVIEY